MKLYMKLFSVLILSLSYLSVYAIDAPQNVSIVSSDDTSVSLSWDEVSDAAGYVVNYSNTPGNYNFQSPNLIEDTVYTLTGLETWETYYFSVVAIDENIDESTPSEELSVVIWWETEWFALSSIEVVDVDLIKLNFNAPLDTSDEAIQEIKVAKRSNPLDELEILDLTIDNTNNKGLYLAFVSTTLPEQGQEYDVTVIELQDSIWRNIESGRDAIETFIGLGGVELESAAPQEASPVVSEIEEASEEVVAPTQSNAGINIDEADVAKSTHSVASENSELPDTGAEHVFLFILAFLLWTSVFIWRFKRV